MKVWLALEVLVESAASEAIEFAFNELDTLGTEINNLGKISTETVTVVGYFNEKVDNGIVREELEKALHIYGFTESAVKNYSWREIENQDWLAEWKKTWKPTVTDKFIIAPLWEKIEETDKIIIRIEPSMAFGTGTHETTRLCLQEIEKSYNGESLLDVGTGTGILAIAAAQIQKKAQKSKGKISGCDVDEDSVRIALENAQVNGAPQIEFYGGSINENTPGYDFILANLTADVIVPLLPQLAAKFKKKLILSGILREQENWISDELRKLGISEVKVKTDGEWISIVVDKSAD